MRLRAGDKHHLRKSAPQKAQNQSGERNERLSDLCFSICRFSEVVFILRAQPHAQSLFLFPIVFGMNMKMKVLRTNSAQSSVIDTEESRHNQRKDQCMSLTLCFTTQQVDHQREYKTKGSETMAYHPGGEGGRGWLSAKVLREALWEDEKRKNRKRSLNRRSELISKCRHENKFHLSSFQPPVS